MGGNGNAEGAGTDGGSTIESLARATAIRSIQTDFAFAYSMMGAQDLRGSGSLQDLYGPPPPHLKRYYDIIREELANGERHIQLIASTGTLKSTVINIIIVQELLKASPKVLFATMAADVRDASTDTIRETMGTLYGKRGDMWRSDKFKLPDWTPGLKFPNFLGATSGRGIEGFRAKLGICDDISDGKSEYSEPYRSQVSRFLRQDFSLRMDEDEHGRLPIVIVGSFWNVDDILMENIKKGWRTHIFPLFGCPMPKGFQEYPNVIHHGEDYTHLWPERHGGLTAEDYMAREKMITQDFELRCQCNPYGAQGKRFRPEWIRTFTDLPPNISSRLEYSVGDDPAVSEKELATNSEASMVILGHDPESGIIYVMENQAGHWGWDDLLEVVHSIYERYKPNPWVIEKSAVSGRYIQYLKHHGPMEEWEVVDQQAGGPKDSRIDTLAPHVRDGKIRFHEECQGLIQQLLAHPGGKKNDRADSLEVGCRRILEEADRPDYEPGYGLR